MKKTPLKRYGTGLKRTGQIVRNTTLKKQSNKYKAGKEDRIAEGLRMMELFDIHWSTHPNKRCESCDKQLRGENLTLYHDHALEKGNSQYEYLKFRLENLILVCWECHSAKTNGHPTTRHKELIEEIYQKHLNGEL